MCSIYRFSALNLFFYSDCKNWKATKNIELCAKTLLYFLLFNRFKFFYKN